jgi:tRNA 2-thiocytidine biosynthesis protein TtcA
MVSFENPLAVKIRKQIVAALSQFNMIEPNDRVMVCCSGGKDSSILLALLCEIRRRAPFVFELEAVMLDQKQPGFDASGFQEWVARLDVPLTIVERDTYSIVKEKVQSGTYCSLCSRLRRAILYDHAVKHNFTKLALGHHRDDINQTLLLNLFYSGKISSMPPKLKSDDGRNILIRPLANVAEEDLQQLAKEWEIPIIPCNLCGSQTGMKRQMVKKLLKDLQGQIPGIHGSMLTAQTNVRESQLSDQHLWNFQELKADGQQTGLQVDHFTGLDSDLI